MRNQQPGQSPIEARSDQNDQPKSRSQPNNKQTVNLGTNPFMDSIETHSSVSVNEFQDWFLRPEEQSPQLSSHIQSREAIHLSSARLRAQSSEKSNVKLTAPFTRKNLKNLLNQKEKSPSNDENSQDSDFTLQESVTDENPNVEVKVKKLNTNNSESKLDSFKKSIAAQSRCKQQSPHVPIPQDTMGNGNIQISSLLKQTQQGRSFAQSTTAPPFVLLPFSEHNNNQNTRFPAESFQKPADSYVPLPARNGITQFPVYQVSQNNENSSILHFSQIDDHLNIPPQQNNSSFFHPQQNSTFIPRQLPDPSNSTSSQFLKIFSNSTIQIPDNSAQPIPLFLRIEEYSKNMRTPNEPMRSKSTGIRGSQSSNPARALKDLRMIQQQSQGLFVQANNSCNTTMEQVWQKQSPSINNITAITPDRNDSLNENSSLKMAPAQFYRNDPNYIKNKYNNSLHQQYNPANFSWNPSQLDASSNIMKNQTSTKDMASQQVNSLNQRISNSIPFGEIRDIQSYKLQKDSNNNANISNRESTRTQSQTQPQNQSSFFRSSSQVQLSASSSASVKLSYSNNIKQLFYASNLQQQQQQLLPKSSSELPKSIIPNQNYLQNSYANGISNRDANSIIDSANYKPLSQQQQMYIPTQYQRQSDVSADKSYFVDQDSFNQSRVGMKISQEKEKQFQIADSAVKSVKVYSAENSPQINLNQTPSSWINQLNVKASPPLHSNIRSNGSKLQDPPSTATSFSVENSAATFKELTKASSAGKPSYPLILIQSKNHPDHPLYVQQVDDIIKQFKVNKPQFDSYTSKTNATMKKPIIAVKLHSAGIPSQGVISKYIK